MQTWGVPNKADAAARRAERQLESAGAASYTLRTHYSRWQTAQRTGALRDREPAGRTPRACTRRGKPARTLAVAPSTLQSAPLLAACITVACASARSAAKTARRPRGHIGVLYGAHALLLRPRPAYIPSMWALVVHSAGVLRTGRRLRGSAAELTRRARKTREASRGVSLTLPRCAKAKEYTLGRATSTAWIDSRRRQALG